MPFDVAIRRGGVIPDPFVPTYLFRETLSLVAAGRLGLEDPETLDDIGLLEAVTRPGEFNPPSAP